MKWCQKPKIFMPNELSSGALQHNELSIFGLSIKSGLIDIREYFATKILQN